MAHTPAIASYLHCVVVYASIYNISSNVKGGKDFLPVDFFVPTKNTTGEKTPSSFKGPFHF